MRCRPLDDGSNVGGHLIRVAPFQGKPFPAFLKRVNHSPRNRFARFLSYGLGENRSWALPFETGRLFIEPADPLLRQLDDFLG